MTKLPMPKDVRAAFEQRLVDIRNTAVADLKITNSEIILSKSAKEPASTASSSQKSDTDVDSSAPLKTGSHIQSVTKAPIQTPSKVGMYVKRFLIGLAWFVILVTLARNGTLRWLIVDILWRSKLIRWVFMVLFNYRIAKATKVLV
jgi:hypothetical protein